MQINILGRDDAESLVAQSLPNASDCVYMCIGTEKILSDSLGPKVGSLIQTKMNKPVFVYGLEESNINALNLLRAYNLIKILHPNKKIVVIDAGVGDMNEVGSIQLSEGSLYPGAATNKNLPEIGDFSIIGIVALRGLKDFYVTSFEREKLICNMAEVIANAIMNK